VSEKATFQKEARHLKG